MNRQRREHKPVAAYTPTSSSEKDDKAKIKVKREQDVQDATSSKSQITPVTVMSLTGPKLVSELPNRLFIKSRLPSFCKWPFKDDGDICTVRKMVTAGFICTGTAEDPSSAECVFCGKEMIFDSTDDPWEEHKSHCPECPFVRLDKMDEHSWSMQDLTGLSVACMGEIANKILKKEYENVQQNVQKSADDLKKMIEKKLDL